MTTAGLLHSDICGSMVICTSPQLFAACRVLRRQISPRHPPYALTILTYVRHTLTFLANLFCLRFPSVRRKNVSCEIFFFRFLLLYSFQRTAKSFFSSLFLKYFVEISEAERMILSKLSSTSDFSDVRPARLKISLKRVSLERR